MSTYPDIILIVCEGKTESIYFHILQRAFRLPTWVKILPEDIKTVHRSLGQHDALFKKAAEKREEYRNLLGAEEIETWAVCDRDNYKDSFTKLQDAANILNINLAFSDPQFENFLLQHFSANKSKSSGKAVEDELSYVISKKFPQYPLYRKTDLSWLEEMIDKKHTTIESAIKNADIYANHTKQPFFTVQRLVERLRTLVE